MTRIAVTGGRDYANEPRAWQILDAARIRLGMTSGIDGGCQSGLDLFARRWAMDRDFPWHTERAKWNEFGRAAGPIRNGVMLGMLPDIVLAFPGGDGTQDMVDQTNAAIKNGARIRLIEIDR